MGVRRSSRMGVFAARAAYDEDPEPAHIVGSATIAGKPHSGALREQQTQTRRQNPEQSPPNASCNSASKDSVDVDWMLLTTGHGSRGLGLGLTRCIATLGSSLRATLFFRRMFTHSDVCVFAFLSTVSFAARGNDQPPAGWALRRFFFFANGILCLWCDETQQRTLMGTLLYSATTTTTPQLAGQRCFGARGPLGRSNCTATLPAGDPPHHPTSHPPSHVFRTPN